MSETLQHDHDLAQAPPDLTDDELSRQLRLQLVDVSGAVEANAVDHAETYLSDQTSQRGFKGFLKRIWHGNIARDYYRYREAEKAKQDILATGNIYALDERSEQEHDDAMEAVVNRFTSDYDLLHSGETNENLQNDDAGQAMHELFRGLVSAYARGEIDEVQLESRKHEYLREYAKEIHSDNRRSGLMFGDNIVQVAKHARAAYEHGVALERIGQALSTKQGVARIGARTELSRNAAERLVDRLHATKVGSLVNEVTLGAAAAVVILAAKFTTQRVVTAAGATVALGAGAAVIGGIREYARVGQERQQHIRDMVTGGQVDPEDARRREQMETTRYESRHVTHLLSDVERARQAVEAAGPASAAEALDGISEAQARILLSDELDIDLISYSDKASVEQERLDLDIGLARAKVAIGRTLESMDDETLSAAGLESRELDDLLAGRVEQVSEQLQSDISDKDEAFRKLRRNRSLKMAGIAGLTGLAFGGLAQEIQGAVSGDMQGVFEEPDYDHDSRTLLTGIFREDLVLPETSVEQVALSDTTNINVPESYSLHEVSGEDSVRELVDHRGNVIATLTVDEEGKLTAGSVAQLEALGATVDTTTHTEYDKVKHTEEVERSAQALLKGAGDDDPTHIRRMLWYDNNTPAPVFDFNELRLDWGGVNATGVNGNGDYEFSVARMTSDGSFHRGLSADAQRLAAEGRLAIAVSVSRDSQSMVYMIPFNADGRAVIDADSPIGQSLFKTEGGQASFVGAYAEAVELRGKADDGRQQVNILATVVGQDRAESFTETVTRTETVETVIETNTYTIPQPEIEQPVAIAPVLPLYARKGLEFVEHPGREAVAVPHYYGGYEERAQYAERLARERSPRLLQDSSVILSPRQELRWYQDQLRTNHSEYYESLKRSIDATPELQDISPSTKAIVSIPVGAAYSADNIYDTLSLYAQQDPEVLDKSTILLHVNWIDDAETDPAKLADIGKTRQEIERAKGDFPQLHIAQIQTTWERESVTERGGVIGDAGRRLYDTALLAALRAKERSDNDDDILIIRNDADAKGMSRHYLRQMVRGMEQSPDKDVFTGVLRWDTAKHRDYPGFGVMTNFGMVMQTASHLRSVRGRPMTSGGNSAIRASTFAAVGAVGHGDYVGAGSDDIEIGNRVYAARTDPAAHRPRHRAGAVSRVEQSPAYRPRHKASADTSDDQSQSARASMLGRLAGRNYGVKQPVKLVVGANIDSAGDRLLNIYRANESIMKPWADFDKGGYKDRTQVDPGVQLIGPEDVKRDLDDIARRIERGISDMATGWFGDPALVRMGLAFTFPEKDSHDKPVYSIKWQDGACEFKLTDDGKKWLGNRLRRDGRGHFDPFGARVRRALYGEVSSSATKQPAAPVPRFVKPA